MCVSILPGPLHGVARNYAQEELVLLRMKLRVVSDCSFKTDASYFLRKSNYDARMFRAMSIKKGLRFRLTFHGYTLQHPRCSGL